MTTQEFDACLVAFHPNGDDNRYVFTGKQVTEIRQALNQRALVDELRDLVNEENASTTKN